MSHGGKRAGAGRKPGLPSKRSATNISRALAEGKKLPPAELLALAEEAMLMVARYRPGTEKKSNTKDREERYAFWMGQAGEFFKAAAPYYAPRLHVLAGEMHHTTQVSISQKLDMTVSAEEAMRRYIEVIDQKPL